jgi:hypothetical protein
VARLLQRQFSPTLNAHINKIGKFDIDPNRGSPLRDLIERGELAAGADFHQSKTVISAPLLSRALRAKVVHTIRQPPK